ncbi:hypothetical protein ACMWQD_29400, partial [Escherichia coli]|uniref:hypothetical protein n=1 Tax=Escherichia coli TaxID=562 RepID=UPI0039E0D86F
KPCSLTEARACLAPNEVALLFVPGDKESFVVVVEARTKADDKTNGITLAALAREADLNDAISCLCDRETFTLPVACR